MMRFFGKLVLTLGALALLASPAWAQNRVAAASVAARPGSSWPRTSRRI